MNIWKTADLLARFQSSKAQKILQLNSLGDHLDKPIVEQVTQKDLEWRTPISPLSGDEKLKATRKGINGNVLRDFIAKLKYDIAPKLGCLQNEHLLALLFNPNHKMTHSAAAALDNLLDYVNLVVHVQFLGYLFATWVACRIVPVNKVDPASDFSHGKVPDCRPVNIGGT